MRTESGTPSGKKVTIGRICGGHGLQGELRIQPLTDFPERFLKMGQLELFHPDGRAWKVLHPDHFRALEGKGLLLVMTTEVKTRDDADELKGALIRIAAEDRVPLPEGRFWIDDLLGMTVRDEDSKVELGVIEEVLPTGSNDCYMVRTPEGGLKALPAIAEVVRNVDLQGHVMEVHLLEGLWD